ncbi:HTH-type transcriptional regulator SyrM 1 [compost metagenome]
MLRRLAELYAEHLPLRLLPPPVQLPVMQEHMLWHRSMERDPMHRWLRERISEFTQQLDLRTIV